MSAPEIIERALAKHAQAADSAGGAVLVSEESGVNLRWAGNTLTTNGDTTGQSVTVVAAVHTSGGTSVGVISRRGVGPDAVADLVEQAQAAARTSPPAEDAAEFISGEAEAGFGEPAETTGPGILSAFAVDLGQALEQARGHGRELFGFAQHETSTTWVGTSAGARRRHVQPQGTVELTGKSHERTRSTWIGQATRDFSDVDVPAMAGEVATRLAWQERRVELEAGRYDTILPPSAVSDLMIYAYWSGDARSAHEGRSVFSATGGGTRVGERLTDVPLTLRSDPAAEGLQCADFIATGGSSPFASVFDNALASPAVSWLDAGVLAALPTTRHTAGLTGLPLRPAVENLLLHGPEGSSGDASSLVGSVERGLLVTCLWYVREVDPRTLLLTGLTRDGVYLIDGGEIAGVVTNFRFNESPIDLLRRVTAVGGTAPTLAREFGDYFTRTAMPPVLVRDFNMSSVSQAS